MNRFVIGFVVALALGGIFFGAVVPKLKNAYGTIASTSISNLLSSGEKSKKSPKELLDEALEKSKDIRGLYMTADVANDQGAGGTRLRNSLLKLATTTEINGMVIDVKEVCGPDYNEKNLKKLLDELKRNNIWAIARIAVFKDESQIETHPEWYLTRKSPKKTGELCVNKRYLREKNPNGAPSTLYWRDNSGGYWMDPANREVWKYMSDFSKKMIDLGFDEIQFDYIRFPSDGDVQNAIYPTWNGKTPKYTIMKGFFEFIHKELKGYKPDIILSADLFGYAATQEGDVGIGQRLDDIGDTFDYISFMVYPSHYYSGFYIPADPVRNLPAVNMNLGQTRSHPEVVIGRSMIYARDFLDGRYTVSALSTTTQATSTPAVSETPKPLSKARLRPWLEDFFHEQDRVAGRPYGAEKVRLQIDAAESTDNHGWLLWNASNVYSTGALKKD